MNKIRRCTLVLTLEVAHVIVAIVVVVVLIAAAALISFIVVSSLDKILHDDVKFAGMRQGKSSFREHIL